MLRIRRLLELHGQALAQRVVKYRVAGGVRKVGDYDRAFGDGGQECGARNNRVHLQ